MKRLSRWTWAWLAWAALGLAIELPAVVNRALGDTLSEHLKWLLGIGMPVTIGVRLRRLVLVAAWAVLPAHLLGWI